VFTKSAWWCFYSDCSHSLLQTRCPMNTEIWEILCEIWVSHGGNYEDTIFLNVMLCSLVDRIASDSDEAAGRKESLWLWRTWQWVLLKYWYMSTSLHDVISQKTVTSTSIIGCSTNLFHKMLRHILCVDFRYVIFYTPFDIGYKAAKFLPIKIVFSAMKEIYR
jgi:hypothetical protein